MNLNFPHTEIKTGIDPQVRASSGTIFEAVALIVAAVIVFNYLVLPKSKNIKSLQAEYTTKKTEFESIEKKGQRLKELIAQMKSEKEKKNLEKLDESIPLSQGGAKNYILFENLAKLSGMTVGDVSVNLKLDKPIAGNPAVLERPFSLKRGLQVMNVSMTTTGTFEQFTNFLQKIESHGRLINVNSIEISASKEEVLDYKISMDAYYFGDVE